MKRVMHVLAILILVAGTFAISSCTSNPEQSQTNKPQPTVNTNTNTAPASRPPKTTATGTISGAPNPIKVCDRSGAGIATLSWTSAGATDLEVRIGKPDGDLFARTGPRGNWKTGKWVGNGMVFYLQDVSGGKPLVPENTIASLTFSVTNEGCP